MKKVEENEEVLMLNIINAVWIKKEIFPTPSFPFPLS